MTTDHTWTLADSANCVVHEFEDKVVFTTTDRTVGELLLKVCEDANISDTEEEYHCQAWLTKK